MPLRIIKQGEHVPRMAAQAGFARHEPIWQHPENDTLRSQRENPCVLLPGDQLFLPDRGQRVEPAATEKRHEFVRLGKPLKLRVVLLDPDGTPMADTACVLRIDADATQLSTDDEGLLEQVITPDAERGRLTVRDTARGVDYEIPVQIGHLDPVCANSGQAARLANLGYDADGEDPPAGTLAATPLRLAVEEFQCDQGLTIDGICGPATQARLLKVHGC